MGNFAGACGVGARVRYAVAMGKSLLACPFCREMFAHGEASSCPTCGLALARLDTLPRSVDHDEEGEAVAAEDQPLPPTYVGRGRGWLAALGLLGMLAFVAPWVHETAPEIRTMNGFELARRLGWIWGAFVAFFVLVPVVLSRRTIRAMRGARAAVAFLGAIPAIAAIVRLVTTPKAAPMLPVRVEWGVGLYAVGLMGLLVVASAPWFGHARSDRRDESAG
jgi:hypothetical protein